MSWTAVAAFLVDVFATIIVSIAYVLMKLGHIEVEQTGMNGKESKRAICTCKWIIGLIFMTVGSIIHVAVLPFVDVVVLSTGTGISLICNTVLSIWFLGERFNLKYDLPAFILIIAGCATIVLLSQFDEIEYTPEDIRRLLKSGGTIVCMVVYFIAVVSSVIQY